MDKKPNRNFGGSDTKGRVEQKNKLIEEIKDKKLQHHALAQQLQPIINSLQQQADQLAAEFRRLFKESQQAYQNEEGALAKQLSLKGQEIQKKCEELNSQVNSYRNALMISRNEIEKLCVLLNEINDQLQLLAKNSEPEFGRNTKVIGFNSSQVISNAEVEEMLNQLPQGLFDLVSEIKFVDEIEISNGNLITGNYHWNQKTGKAQIEIYAHGFKDKKFKEEILKKTKSTIIHEIGHLIFREILADTARYRWGTYYLESLQTKNFLDDEDPGSREEDFSDCFIEFIYNPRKLEKYDQTRYAFIKKIWEITIGF